MNLWFYLNLLPIAVAFYEERGVSKTATRLGISQTAVSAALENLRKMLDDPLLSASRSLGRNRAAYLGNLLL